LPTALASCLTARSSFAAPRNSSHKSSGTLSRSSSLSTRVTGCRICASSNSSSEMRSNPGTPWRTPPSTMQIYTSNCHMAPTTRLCTSASKSTCSILDKASFSSKCRSRRSPSPRHSKKCSTTFIIQAQKKLKLRYRARLTFQLILTRPVRCTQIYSSTRFGWRPPTK